LAAAETAGANGQFAAEVMCLQTATQFAIVSWLMTSTVSVRARLVCANLQPSWKARVPVLPPGSALLWRLAMGLNWLRG
jgi:hypothetical protein